MGNILLVDKPKGITSFDVCFKMRKIFGTKKIGHTGTLDPNATGLMMILVGNATKANQFLVSSSKEYIAKVKLGVKTDTLDIDGKIILTKDETMPTASKIEKVILSFVGKSYQKPPMTSAVKVNGKKLLEYQRKGLEVEVKEREIEVFEIELLSLCDDSFIFRCKVSSGTYVRVLVQDILEKLNLIGTLLELRRTKIDSFKVEDAYTIAEIESGRYTAMGMYDVLSKCYQVYKTNLPENIINGRPQKIDNMDDIVLCVDQDENVLAIYQKAEDGLYRCIRGLL